ncbi:Phenmedipham hydrolase [Poriferisphaera corsica]|uniref:Phenmedipham hydrolase n=1 Tax=Poriferisphaera corsica TaxID=2528020 RepID=A0A517YYW3_9BACT|nr:alpha/beta hydrolase [Poriferisphaera corsica]QDU35406.1 Phenmedipham hydrolase [Poriferisphaera corsica]
MPFPTPTHTNINYRPASEQSNPLIQQRCVLDIFLPQSWIENTHASTRQTVIYIHGGGLIEGQRNDNPDLTTTLLNNNIAVITADYRLSSDGITAPTYIHDVAAITAWVFNNIHRYLGNSQNITLLGHSAGAYLITMIATDPQYLAPHNLKPEDLAAVIPVSGQMLTHEQIKTEQSINNHTVITDKFAPLFHHAKTDVPILLVVGVNDIPCREQENALFAAYRQRAEKPIKFLPVPDRDHHTIIFEAHKPNDIVFNTIKQFIDNHKRDTIQTTA